MQTINRNNYEEFFLLYADNELDAAHKLEVENFVQQNTDLAIELNMLVQTKLEPEEILFTDKEILLRTEGNCINETNYEEHFLLYIDNELSAAKRKEVEIYILQHPRLQNEFTILKQAVLKPEAITFNDKKDLYRTEKRRTVYFKPWRFAAAAIFIGMCAIGWWLLQKPEQTGTVAINHPVNKIKPNIVAKPADTIHQQIKQPEQIVAQQILPSTKSIIENEKPVVKKKSFTPKNNENDIAEHKPVQENKTHNITEQNNIAKQIPQPLIEKNDVAIEAIPLNKVKQSIAVPQAEENNESNDNGYKIYNVSYKEINTTEDDNSLHVGVFDLNKNKVKNLFKKAGRLFGNKANENANEDGKLQVANFEIQTNKQ